MKNKITRKDKKKLRAIKTFDPTSTYKSRTTIGKTYELFPLDDGDYYFIDDYGDKPIYFKKYFVTVEQWREQQLNQLGI